MAIISEGRMLHLEDRSKELTKASARIDELEAFLIAEGDLHYSHREFEKMETRNELLITTLGHAREKLELYRDNSDGRYHGGIEHTALIKMIDTSIAVQGQT